MGLFDQVAGMLLNGDVQKYQTILNWVNSQGGVMALVEKFQRGGLAEVVTSWLSSSQTNQAISGDQVTSVLGSPAVTDLANKLGIDMGAAASMIASYLPAVIDALSPHGEVDAKADNDLLTVGMKLMKDKLFS